MPAASWSVDSDMRLPDWVEFGRATTVLAMLLMPLYAAAAEEPTASFDLARPAIAAFIDARVAEGASREHVTAILAGARPQPKILEAMGKPAEQALPWYEYRARFITDERINAGVKLWREHRDELERIARERRVSPQYILAIAGVETFYGRITGRYRVLDALSTLAFDYPPRAAFFQSELAQFLKLTDEESLDPTAVLGSYAGAMGVAQFMPSSYRKFAVDGDGDRGRNLWTDWSDVFASIANYLAQHGWQYGGSVMANATFSGVSLPDFVDKVALNETLGSLQSQGFAIDSAAWSDTPALVISAPQATQPAYRVGFKNFYVITRYNRSPMYAMAVSDLADALSARMDAAAPPAPGVSAAHAPPAAP
jgi:membrane-bound lytic murein transglycosylase B